MLSLLIDENLNHRILRGLRRSVAHLDYASRKTSDCMRTLRMNSTPPHDKAIEWLLDGDPAIRWQTLRDLVGASERSVELERSKIAREGWGARLLARQDRTGAWAGGLSSRNRCRASATAGSCIPQPSSRLAASQCGNPALARRPISRSRICPVRLTRARRETSESWKRCPGIHRSAACTTRG